MQAVVGANQSQTRPRWSTDDAAQGQDGRGSRPSQPLRGHAGPVRPPRGGLRPALRPLAGRAGHRRGARLAAGPARRAGRDGIARRITPHELRRTYGTWLWEAGVDTRVVQVLLGHESPETASRYAAVRPELIRKTPTPLSLP